MLLHQFNKLVCVKSDRYRLPLAWIFCVCVNVGLCVQKEQGLDCH